MIVSMNWMLMVRNPGEEAWTPDTQSFEESSARDNHANAPTRLVEGAEFKTVRTEVHETVESW